jgi:hypothetical protein
MKEGSDPFPIHSVVYHLFLIITPYKVYQDTLNPSNSGPFALVFGPEAVTFEPDAVAFGIKSAVIQAAVPPLITGGRI